VRTDATENGTVRDVIGPLLRVEVERPQDTRHTADRQEHSPYRNLHGGTLRTNALLHGCHRRDARGRIAVGEPLLSRSDPRCGSKSYLATVLMFQRISNHFAEAAFASADFVAFRFVAPHLEAFCLTAKTQKAR